MPDGLTLPGLGALITVGFLLPLLYFERSDAPTPKLATKPFASVGFLVAAYGVGALDTTPGQAMFAGLVLSLLGDVLLIFQHPTAFLAGLAAFLLGHVAYTVAFVLAGISPWWAGVTAVLAGAAATIVYGELRPKLPPDMVKPVVAYMVVISAMVVCAFGAFGAHQAGLLIPIGAVAFYLSDISVALDRFDDAGYGNRLLGLPLYYGAQLVLAIGAVTLL